MNDICVRRVCQEGGPAEPNKPFPITSPPASSFSLSVSCLFCILGIYSAEARTESSELLSIKPILNVFPTGVVCLLNRFSLPDLGTHWRRSRKWRQCFPNVLHYCVCLSARKIALSVPTKPCLWCSRFPIDDTVWCGWVTLGPCKLQ